MDVKCSLYLGRYRSKIDRFNVEFCGAKLWLFKYGNAAVTSVEFWIGESFEVRLM
jgi:hypothetical protein